MDEFLCCDCEHFLSLDISVVGQEPCDTKKRLCLLYPELYSQFGSQYKDDDRILNVRLCSQYKKKKR